MKKTNNKDVNVKGCEILRKECPEFLKQLAMEKIVDMYEIYVDSKKDDIPDIPIISAKELQKQKTLDKK